MDEYTNLQAINIPDEPDDTDPSHHEKKEPGSDRDHQHDDDKARERKENWDRHHHPDKPPK